jgi:hypothetical protein
MKKRLDFQHSDFSFTRKKRTAKPSAGALADFIVLILFMAKAVSYWSIHEVSCRLLSNDVLQRKILEQDVNSHRNTMQRKMFFIHLTY